MTRARLLRLRARVLWVVVLSLALVAVPSAGMAAEIKDVPKDHWAYQAVKTLVEKGYLAVYGDGTFQGAKPVDRYTLAVVIAKILREIETGKVGATPEDVDLLRKLSGEFRQELVQVANDMNIFKKSLDEQGKAQAVLREDLAKLTFTQRQMRSEVEKMIADIAASTEKTIAAADQRARQAEDRLAARIDGSEQRIGRLADDVARGFDNTQSSLKDLGARMDAGDASLGGRLDAHDAKLVQLDEDLSAAILRLTALEPQVALVTESLVAAKKDLGKSIDTLRLDLEGARGDILALRKDLGVAQGDILALRKDIGALSSAVDARVAELGARDAKLEKDLGVLAGRTLTLEESLTTERAARISTDTSLQTALTDLAQDLAAHKAQTAKDVDSLRKENGLLKVLLAAVAILGLVVK
ncbi:MAG: S-layer homology domain-containing protein [Bacillota bacterium]|nr:S-layer homology domain-containing protein [Bacillota bacterium]